MRIRTRGGRIHDEIDLVEARGHKVDDITRLDSLRFSVLLTRQFSYFLGSAPDPSVLRRLITNNASRGVTFVSALTSSGRLAFCHG